MSALQDIGNRIKQKRIALGMTQEELALLVGYTSRSSINKIELGLVDLPQSRAKRIANALNTTTAYILWGKETSIQPQPQEAATPQISKEAAALIETLSNLPSEKADFANRVLELVNLMLQVPAERFPLLEDLLRVCLKNL